MMYQEAGMGQTAWAPGVPLSMSRIKSELLDADFSNRSPADVLAREEPDDEEDEEDDGKEKDEDEEEDEEDGEGYSE